MLGTVSIWTPPTPGSGEDSQREVGLIPDHWTHVHAAGFPTCRPSALRVKADPTLSLGILILCFREGFILTLLFKGALWKVPFISSSGLLTQCPTPAIAVARGLLVPEGLFRHIHASPTFFFFFLYINGGCHTQYLACCCFHWIYPKALPCHCVINLKLNSCVVVQGVAERHQSDLRLQRETKLVGFQPSVLTNQAGMNNHGRVWFSTYAGVHVGKITGVHLLGHTVLYVCDFDRSCENGPHLKKN